MPSDAVTARLLEFLHALIHLCLHSHGVYPSSLFQTRRLHSLPLPYCAHAPLRDYITRVLSDVRPLLAAGRVRALTLVIGRARAPRARYVLEFEFPAHAEPRLAALELHLRAHLARVLAEGGREGRGVTHVDEDVPEWDLVLETDGVHGVEWVPADGDERGGAGGRVVPLKDPDLRDPVVRLASRLEIVVDAEGE